MNSKPAVNSKDAVVQWICCMCVCCGLQSDLHPGSIWEGTSEAADPYWIAQERNRSRHEGVAFGQSPNGGEHPTRSQRGHTSLYVCFWYYGQCHKTPTGAVQRVQSSFRIPGQMGGKNTHTHSQPDKNETFLSKLKVWIGLINLLGTPEKVLLLRSFSKSQNYLGCFLWRQSEKPLKQTSPFGLVAGAVKVWL